MNKNHIFNKKSETNAHGSLRTAKWSKGAIAVVAFAGALSITALGATGVSADEVTNVTETTEVVANTPVTEEQPVNDNETVASEPVVSETAVDTTSETQSVSSEPIVAEDPVADSQPVNAEPVAAQPLAAEAPAASEEELSQTFVNEVYTELVNDVVVDAPNSGTNDVAEMVNGFDVDKIAESVGLTPDREDQVLINYLFRDNVSTSDLTTGSTTGFIGYYLFDSASSGLKESWKDGININNPEYVQEGVSYHTFDEIYLKGLQLVRDNLDSSYTLYNTYDELFTYLKDYVDAEHEFGTISFLSFIVSDYYDRGYLVSKPKSGLTTTTGSFLFVTKEDANRLLVDFANLIQESPVTFKEYSSENKSTLPDSTLYAKDSFNIVGIIYNNLGNHKITSVFQPTLTSETSLTLPIQVGDSWSPLNLSPEEILTLWSNESGLEYYSLFLGNTDFVTGSDGIGDADTMFGEDNIILLRLQQFNPELLDGVDLSKLDLDTGRYKAVYIPKELMVNYVADGTLAFEESVGDGNIRTESDAYIVPVMSKAYSDIIKMLLTNAYSTYMPTILGENNLAKIEAQGLTVEQYVADYLGQIFSGTEIESFIHKRIYDNPNVTPELRAFLDKIQADVKSFTNPDDYLDDLSVETFRVGNVKRDGNVISATTSYVADSNLALGKTEVRTQAVDGFEGTESVYKVQQYLGTLYDPTVTDIKEEAVNGVIAVGNTKETTSTIEFTTEYIEDDTLAQGVEIEEVAGINGSVTNLETYTVNATNGTLSDSPESVTELSRTEATKRIVRVGTHVPVTIYQGDDSQPVGYRSETVENNGDTIVTIGLKSIESEIPYNTIEQEDATLTVGERKVITNGVAGKEITTYTLNTTTGEVTETKTVINNAVDEVIAVGTHVPVTIYQGDDSQPVGYRDETVENNGDTIVTVGLKPVEVEIPYNTVEQEDATLLLGERRIITAGVLGKEVTTYTLNTTTGEVTESKTVVDAIDEVIAIGTFIEPIVETPEEPVVETPKEPVVETPKEPVVETPKEPVTPTPVPVKEVPTKEVEKPQNILSQETSTPVETSQVNKASVLPETGEENTSSLSIIGLGLLFSAVGLSSIRKRRSDS